MPRSISAQSISQHVSQELTKGPFAAHVLSSFEHACNLVTRLGDVVTLVTPKIGNGPLNIVVEDDGQCFSEIAPKIPARLENGCLIVGDLQIDLTGAQEWDPRPDWDKLRERFTVILSRLQYLAELGQNYAAATSLLAHLGKPATGNNLEETFQAAIHTGGQNLRVGWTSDPEILRDAASKLAGLGQGLTPAGDDFLIGAMLWAWLAHPNPDLFCEILLQPTASQTTTLSAAFLRAAARGECDKWWQALLVALGEGSFSEINAAAQMVLARGATSGADTLAGFLYLGPGWP
jgi:hypothetical protein